MMYGSAIFRFYACCHLGRLCLCTIRTGYFFRWWRRWSWEHATNSFTLNHNFDQRSETTWTCVAEHTQSVLCQSHRDIVPGHLVNVYSNIRHHMLPYSRLRTILQQQRRVVLCLHQSWFFDGIIVLLLCCMFVCVSPSFFLIRLHFDNICIL